MGLWFGVMLKLNGIWVFLINNMLTFGVIFKFLPGVTYLSNTQFMP
jgi:hypothetical protein